MSNAPRIDGQRLLAAVPSDYREPATVIARRLAEAGYRAWIVGGCVRDLVLGRPLKDLDLVSAALPDVVEGMFEHTVVVGKSFGIVVVVLDGIEFEVATFRRERGYSDRRRPDEIEFSDSPEVDARRRDFTCNALFLDPLSGAVLDPEGGLDDLAAGMLRAVGDPAGRFREDGLRILRMARFVSTLGLATAPGLVEAARGESSSLEGVSPERVLDELGKVLTGPNPAVAIDVLAAGGHASRCIPGWAADAKAAALRPRVLELLGDAPGTALGLAVLLEVSPLDSMPEEERLRRTGEAVAALRASREHRRAVPSLTRMRRHLAELAEDTGRRDGAGSAEERGELVALWRDPLRPDGLRLATAWAAAAGRDGPARNLQSLETAALRLDAVAPSQPVTLSAADLMAAGIAQGPHLGTALRRLEHAALGGAFDDRAGALAWVEANLR